MVQEVLLDFTPEEEEVLLTALSKLNRHIKEIYMGPKKETNNTLQQDDKWRAPK
jgi:hypothetical protein